jgi:hypothetical protein
MLKGEMIPGRSYLTELFRMSLDHWTVVHGRPYYVEKIVLRLLEQLRTSSLSPEDVTFTMLEGPTKHSTIVTFYVPRKTLEKSGAT